MPYLLYPFARYDYDSVRLMFVLGYMLFLCEESGGLLCGFLGFSCILGWFWVLWC